MIHNTVSLSTVEECDSLIASISDRKNTLISRRTILQIRQNGDVADVPAIHAEIAAELQRITILTGQIAAMPEGPAKKDLELDLHNAQGKVLRLEKQLRHNGPAVTLERELELFILQTEIDECDVLITATNTRRTEIQGS